MPRPKKPATAATKHALIERNADLSPADLKAKAEREGVEVVVVADKKPSKVAKKTSKAPAKAAARKLGPKPKKGGMSASEFVRSQPSGMPAKAVVAAGKKAGLTFTDGLVYAVRSYLKRTAVEQPVARKAAPAKAKAVPAKRAAPKKPERKLTASAFIRSQPKTVSAKDVIALGAKQGLKFSANLVYAVRSAAGSKKAAPKPAAEKPAAKATRVSTSDTSPETILAKLVLAHGFGKVEEMLAAAGKRVESLLVGR